MAFSTTRSILGFSIILATAFGCDDGTGTDGSTGGSSSTGGGTGTGSGGGTPGSGGGTPGSGGGGNGEVTGTTIFDGTGTWVDGTTGPAATFGIQGAFFVLEDGVKDGTPVPADGLTHSDLTPDKFDDTTAKPCVSGSVALVTGADGAECDPSGTGVACEWSSLWGGGIGLNLNETGGDDSVKSPLNLTEKGVTGFSFNISGSANGATVRFKVKDATNGDADFCTAIVTPGASTVKLADLKHNCYDGGVASAEPDFTTAVQLEWQIVTSATSAYDVENFCIEQVAVLTD